MLVLTRKVGERIHIGNAVVCLRWIKKGRVQISIEAPKDVQILRGEFLDKKACTALEAAVESPTAERDSSAH